MIGVGPLGARLDVDAQAPPVVPGERGHRAPDPRAPAQRRPQQVGGFAHRPDPGGMGQQVPQCRRPEARPGGDQPVGAQVAAGGRVEVDQSLFPQLHDGDRCDGLGDRGDPEDGVLVDRRPDSMSATPCPWNHARDPSRTTPTARPATGQWLRTSPTLVFSSSSSTHAVTTVPPSEPHHGAHPGRIAGRVALAGAGPDITTSAKTIPRVAPLWLAGHRVTVSHKGPVPR